MHGSIVQRGKKFAVVLYAGRDPENPAKERRKWYHGFETRRDAEAFRVTLASHPAFSAGLGLYGSNRLRTGDYLDRWLKSHASTGAISETTEDWYRMVHEKHLKPVIGHIPLARLSPQTIQELYGALVAKGLSRTTVKHIANQLHLALGHAVKRGLIVRNPSESTDPPSRDTKSTSVLSPEQLRVFLNLGNAS